MFQLLPQLLDLDIQSSQKLEKTLTTVPPYGKETGPLTDNPDHMTKTAQSLNQTTGKVPNNALNHGNAEVPDSAKEEDGAQVMMDAKVLHSQIKHQVYQWITEQ